uniref:Uncharacterized protein n=1 Tax=Anguilla anguilla TaxID=7936 RepID=A0A0E9XA92_ANGAN
MPSVQSGSVLGRGLSRSLHTEVWKFHRPVFCGHGNGAVDYGLDSSEGLLLSWIL